MQLKTANAARNSLGVILSAMSGFFAVAWLNALGKLSAWVGLPIDPDMLASVKRQSEIYGLLGLAFPILGGYLLRFSGEKSDRKSYDFMMGNIIEFLSESRNNYFIRAVFSFLLALCFAVFFAYAVPAFTAILQGRWPR